MADLLPSRIEPLGDSPGQAADSRRERPPQPKGAERPAATHPPVDAEPEQDEAHQLDELA